MLLGSTQGRHRNANVQKRLVALHHLDAPWKPAEVEQREGRILRQGNENEEVAVYRYVTEKSFDNYVATRKRRLVHRRKVIEEIIRPAAPRTSAARNFPMPRSRRLHRATRRY